MQRLAALSLTLGLAATPTVFSLRSAPAALLGKVERYMHTAAILFNSIIMPPYKTIAYILICITTIIFPIMAFSFVNSNWGTTVYSCKTNFTYNGITYNTTNTFSTSYNLFGHQFYDSNNTRLITETWYHIYDEYHYTLVFYLTGWILITLCVLVFIISNRFGSYYTEQEIDLFNRLILALNTVGVALTIISYIMWVLLCVPNYLDFVATETRTTMLSQSTTTAFITVTVCTFLSVFLTLCYILCLRKKIDTTVYTQVADPDYNPSTFVEIEQMG
jgi:hypothetical protein